MIVIIILVVLITYLYYINYEARTVVVSSQAGRREPAMKKVKVMTYNIHHGVGNDRKLNLGRISKTIEESGAVIIGLNEVDNKMPRTDFINQSRFLAERLGMNYAYGPNLKTIIGSYGNAILTSLPLSNVKNYPLPTGLGGEPRGLLEADVLLPGWGKIKVLSTHLSTEQVYKDRQIRWLRRHIAKIDVPYILIGDFNSDLETEKITETASIVSEKTYPSFSPEKKLDKFISSFQVEKSYTLPTEGSDHLPLVIEFILEN